MTRAEERRKIIEDRLKEAFAPTYLEVLYESDQHIGHPGHQGGARHYAITISAPCFQGLSRIASHQKIYALFTDMMPKQLHALRIKVIT